MREFKLARTVSKRAEVERRGRSRALVALCSEREAARDGRRSVRSPHPRVEDTTPRWELRTRAVRSSSDASSEPREAEDTPKASCRSPAAAPLVQTNEGRGVSAEQRKADTQRFTQVRARQSRGAALDGRRQQAHRREERRRATVLGRTPNTPATSREAAGPPSVIDACALRGDQGALDSKREGVVRSVEADETSVSAVRPPRASSETSRTPR